MVWKALLHSLVPHHTRAERTVVVRNLRAQLVADLRALRRRFQMIFQDPFASLDPRWRVGDIIAEPLRTFGLATGAGAAHEVDRLLDTVGLSARDAEKFPH